MSTRREALAFLASTLAVLAGCEAPDRRTGVVIVGSSPSGVPFSFIDPTTNELTGSMIDTIVAVAEQAQLAIELRVLPFSALLPSLRAGKIDVIAAAMLRTAEREQVVAFSDPVFSYAGGLVVAENDPNDYPRLEALRQLRVGVQVGSRFVDQVKDAGIEQVFTYDNFVDMVRDVSFRRIDAAYADAPILKYYLRVSGRRGVRIVQGFVPPAEEELCFILRHNDPNLPKINQAIAALNDSRIPEIIRKWKLHE